MRVAELTAPYQFHLTEAPIEPPGPGEIQVRVESVGICGSDLHSYSEGAIGDTPNIYPMVLGHEPAGVIVATGPGVSGLAPGDRGALEPALYCYHCEFCRSGRHNICANIRFLSNPTHPGFFRDRVNLPASNFLPVAPGVSLDHVTLAEPLAVALHSLKYAAIELGDSVAVFGAGPIGLLTIAALRFSGAGRIYAVEPLAHRRELARHMGAHAVFDASGGEVREIINATGGRGVDCAIDCAAKEHTTNLAIQAARNGGRVVLTGIHSACYVPLEVSPMRRKELAIFNVRRSNHESHAALDLITANPAVFAPLVTHTRPLDQIAAAFDIAGGYRDQVGKMIVRPA